MNLNYRFGLPLMMAFCALSPLSAEGFEGLTKQIAYVPGAQAELITFTCLLVPSARRTRSSQSRSEQ